MAIRISGKFLGTVAGAALLAVGSRDAARGEDQHSAMQAKRPPAEQKPGLAKVMDEALSAGGDNLSSLVRDYDSERLTARFAILRRDCFAARDVRGE